MADNCIRTPGSGENVAADEVTDGTLGSCKVQYVKIMDGTLDGTTKVAAGANGLAVDVKSIAAGTNAIGKLSANSGVDIGDVDVLSVPSPLSTAGNGTAATAHRVTIASDSTGQVALATGSNAIGKLAANSGVDIGDVDVLSLPALTVAKCISWSHYSNEFTTAQTSQDLVALSGSTVFYIGRLSIGTAGTTAGLVTIYFGTGAYSAGTSKTVFRGKFAPGTSAYPGVVIGNGNAPFILSAAGDALKITTDAAITVYVQVDYIRV